MGSDHALDIDREQATVRDAGILAQLIDALEELIHFDDLELEITMAEIEADLNYGRD